MHAIRVSGFRSLHVQSPHVATIVEKASTLHSKVYEKGQCRKRSRTGCVWICVQDKQDTQAEV